jgi:hypothetical protein
MEFRHSRNSQAIRLWRIARLGSTHPLRDPGPGRFRRQIPHQRAARQGRGPSPFALYPQEEVPLRLRRRQRKNRLLLPQIRKRKRRPERRRPLRPHHAGDHPVRKDTIYIYQGSWAEGEAELRLRLGSFTAAVRGSKAARGLDAVKLQGRIAEDAFPPATPPGNHRVSFHHVI